MTCKIDHTDPDGIPDFLCRTCNPLIRAHEAGEPGPSAYLRGPHDADYVQDRQAKLRAAQAATREEKRKASLAKHLDNHKFEKWDAKAGMWVRDDDKINAHHKTMD
jgi:hypothetical protein